MTANHDPDFSARQGPMLPSGLSARQLLADAAALLRGGMPRDHIVERFTQLGIEEEVAAAFVDAVIPAQADAAEADVPGTEPMSGGNPSRFVVDPMDRKRERREAKRERQARLVRELLQAEEVPNPELA